LSDIPNYAVYLKELNGLRARYQEFLLKGRFIDNEGFCLDNQDLAAKAYRAGDGRVAVVLWNKGDCSQCYSICGLEDGAVSQCGTVAPSSVAVVVL